MSVWPGKHRGAPGVLTHKGESMVMCAVRQLDVAALWQAPAHALFFLKHGGQRLMKPAKVHGTTRQATLVVQL